MAFAVGALDDAIREYLLFRGFTQTLKLFETERRDDKDKGFSFRVRPRCASIRTPPGQLVCAHTHTHTTAGEPDRGVHNAVCVQVRLSQSPELLVPPVRSVLQPDE